MKTITFYHANGPVYPSISDADLAALYQHGADIAAAVLYARYDARTHNVILSIVKDECAARDIQVEVFHAVLESIRCGSCAESADLRALLVRMSRQKAAEYISQIFNEAM